MVATPSFTCFISKCFNCDTLQDQYLLMRGFDVSNALPSNQFVPKLLESQAFALFVQDNGPPFRRLHIFDEVMHL